MKSAISVAFVILPFVTFPLCSVYLPKRLRPLDPNPPTHPNAGIPVYDVTKAVPDAAGPMVPQAKLAPKKIFASGLGEQ